MDGHFSVVDYCCFAAVLVFSSLIGFYHGVISRKRPNTREQYLLGGRNMNIFPIICSLVATSISGMTIVGLSAETYAYGSHTWLVSISLLIANMVFIWIYIPVLSELKVTSSFQYLEMRFSRNVRIFASGLHAMAGLVYLPLVVYVPALMFEKVTGINIYATIIVLSLICSVYTAIGGYRAVVWTDVLQLILITASCCCIAVIGVKSVGGFGKAWETADKGGRIIWINVSDISSRTSILTHINGILLNIYQFQLNQANVQRYLSLSSMKNVKLVSWVVSIAFGIFVCLAQVIGIVMYTTYVACDPVAEGMIERVDQILPHFVQEKASLFIGFNGIFIAGIFAASLSTTSSYLNALGGTIYEDFISYHLPNISEKAAQNIMKCIIIVFGILQVLMVIVIKKLGMIFEISNQLMSFQMSMLLGLFTVGMLLRKINGKGAQIGACAAGVAVLILIIGGRSAKPETPLPVRTDECANDGNYANFLNGTIANKTITSSEDPSDDSFWLFKIPFTYYGLFGFFINLLTSYIVSVCTGGNKIENENLLAPFLRKKTINDTELVHQKEDLIK